jgi:hypothetical protein
VSLKSRLRLRAQEGFTTVTLLGVLMVGGLLVTAGFATVTPDVQLSAKDRDYKQAYATAEAGLNFYLYHLGQDNNYYLQCNAVSGINQPWSGSGTDPRTWRNIPGSDAQYSVELLPNTGAGYTVCKPNVAQSMIDSTSGTFRIRATGRVPNGRGGYNKRSIVASLRRKSFIDFLYFTDVETADPATYPTVGNLTTPGTQVWASKYCAPGVYRSTRPSGCTNIQFADNDAVNGPLHSNDSILTCNTPIFGRTKNDAIELGDTTPGYVKACANQTPTFLGTRVWPGGVLPMPPTNQELKQTADPNYIFTGATKIQLTGATMSVTNAAFGTTPKVMNLPANGVIYVDSSACPSNTYTYKQDYTASSTCGNVEVKGNYSSNLTIGAANDIIVTGNITRNTSSLLMGMIANNFVRVYHPVINRNASNTDCDNYTSTSQLPSGWNMSKTYPGTLANQVGPGAITIQSAILALNHSFIVDNWYCGNAMGNLSVDGAIAQEYRGPVGLTSGPGYIKNYTYNDLLRFQEPPFFIDPVQSSWKIVRQNEQIPAR